MIKSFSQELLISLLKFRKDPSVSSTLLLKNLPVDSEIKSTPLPDNTVIEKNTFVSEGVLLGIGQLLGEVCGYENERNGS